MHYEYSYDDLYRLAQRQVYIDDSDFYQDFYYEYRDQNTTTTTAQFKTVASCLNTAEEYTYTEYTFEYDTRGNITKITGTDGNVTQYTYDDMGQLTREDNPYLNKTYVYTYDNAGNRTSKKTYAYTTGTLGTATATQTLTYSTGAWGDQLTGTTYDAVGNPTTYNGFTMTWSGRQLKSMVKNGGQYSYSFTYNDDGIRTSKTSQGVKHTYILEGSRIVGEQFGVHFLLYLYDESGAPIGLQHRTSSYAAGVFDTYYFEKNVFGDIVGIYTADGTKIGTYKYDAWGNCTRTAATGTTALQKQIFNTYNPFRYRGYYYDVETQLYYLQSRYYDPSTGRFLNADGYISTGTGLLGYNMYAYCNNNPVNMIDINGDLPFFAITAAIGAVVGAVVGGVVAAKNGGNVWAGIGLGAATGGLIGLGAGAAAGALLAGSVTATTSMVVAGAGSTVTAFTAGGIGGGTAYLYSNLTNAISNLSADVGALFSSTTNNAGVPFVQGQKPGNVQIGVDPNTLISNGRTILPEKLDACIARCKINGGIYGHIEVYSNGVIYDGHHRVEYAKRIGASVDVWIRQGRP